MSNFTLPASRCFSIAAFGYKYRFQSSILKDVLRIMNISGIIKKWCTCAECLHADYYGKVPIW